MVSLNAHDHKVERSTYAAVWEHIEKDHGRVYGKREEERERGEGVSNSDRFLARSIPPKISLGDPAP